MHSRTDHQTADNVDDQNHDADDRVTFNKLACTVHGTVKVCFLLDFFPPRSRFLLIDQPGVQIGVNAHLLPGHRVQRKTCANFRYPFGPFRNDDKLYNDQDKKDDKTDRQLSAGDEITKRMYDLPCVRFT